MQWGHIKTLFILSFLLLDIYLVVQFMEKQDNADLGILDNPETSIADRLESENITIHPSLNMEITEETYILSSQKHFNRDDFEPLGDSQEIAFLDGNQFLISQFDEPIPLPEEPEKEDIISKLHGKILHFESYSFWEWNKDLNIVVFFQKQNERPVFYNENGIILVFLNDKNEMTHYTQTTLDEPEVQGSGTKPLIEPIQAVETLYNNNNIKPDEEVTDVKMGYYSRFNSEEEQVFAPTWKITVNEDRDYFINAIEGFIFSSNETTDLYTMIEEIKLKVQALDDESDVKKSFMDLLDNYNRSEIKNDVKF